MTCRVCSLIAFVVVTMKTVFLSHFALTNALSHGESLSLALDKEKRISAGERFSRTVRGKLLLSGVFPLTVVGHEQDIVRV